MPYLERNSKVNQPKLPSLSQNQTTTHDTRRARKQPEHNVKAVGRVETFPSHPSPSFQHLHLLNNTILLLFEPAVKTILQIFFHRTNKCGQHGLPT
jgi:hypothetical protein